MQRRPRSCSSSIEKWMRACSLRYRVRFVQRVGVGFDNLDLEALQAAGVVVAYTPGANAVAVAEHT
jgi:D-3-phosphoglycerate dehydrogenase